MNCSNRTVSSCDDDLVAGALLAGTSAISFALYVLVLVAIVRSKNVHFKNVYYVFVISLGIEDVCALVLWFFLGLHIVLHGSLLSDLQIDYGIGVLMTLWNVFEAHAYILSVSRYLAICRPAWHYHGFEAKLKPKFWLCLMWFVAVFVVSVINFWPPMGAYFRIDGYTIRLTPVATSFYSIYSPTVMSGLAITVIFCYGSIYINYRKAKAAVSHLSMYNEHGPNMGLQFRLAAQAFTICAMFSFWDISWYYTEGIVPTDKWFTFVYYTYLWTFNHAANPFIYLIFDKNLRNAVLGREA